MAFDSQPQPPQEPPDETENKEKSASSKTVDADDKDRQEPPDPWYQDDIEFGKRVFSASLRLAAFAWLVWSHRLLDTYVLVPMFGPKGLEAQVMVGGTHLAFIGLYVSLLVDLIMCFWKGNF